MTDLLDRLRAAEAEITSLREQLRIANIDTALLLAQSTDADAEIARLRADALRRQAEETSAELNQLRRIDQAARAFVNAVTEFITFKGGQRAFAVLCDALFDGRPAAETAARTCCAECKAPMPESGGYTFAPHWAMIRNEILCPRCAEKATNAPEIMETK